jgi:cytoskeletal protein CcmA (bactofilin family)
MFGSSKKRKISRIDTLVGQHTVIQGDVRFSGGLHIDGTIKGNVTAENDGVSMLSVSDNGTIEGEVNVPHIILNGVVIGDVHASKHVELSSKARINGNVHYNLIEMAIGAEVNGKLVHAMEPMDTPLSLGNDEPVE